MRITSFLIVYFIVTVPLRAQSFFIERSSDYGLSHMYQSQEVIWGSGVTFFDFSGDGLDDLSFTSGAGDSLQFYESTGTSFINRGGLGLDELDESKQLIWVDYDNDGDKDLFVTNLLAQSRLWQNNGSLEFEDVTSQAGIVINNMPTFGAVWGDYDRDGCLDLYLTNYTSPNYAFDLPGPKRNYLYHNQCDGTFKEVAVSQSVDLKDFHYFSAAFLDLNNNNWPELFVVQDLAANPSQTGNVLFWNNKGDYLPATNSEDLESIRMNAMCIAPSDYDRDGDLDIFIANTGGYKSKFYQNNGDSSFTEKAALVGLEFNDAGASWGAQFFDFDNDGFEDVGITGAKPVKYYPRHIDKLYLNNGSTFTELNSSHLDLSDSARSFSLASGDYNADGKLDFAIATADIDSVKFYENIVSNGSNYLSCNLVGTVSNRDGIGAWVRCYTNGILQVRYTTCGIGFLSQNSHNVHFGLDSITVVDSLQVQWPSGWSDWYYDVSANQVLDILEGETADFRFYLVPSDTVYLCSNEIIILRTDVGYSSYNWNNDSPEDSLVVSRSGNYACSVVAGDGTRGFSYPVRVIHEGICSPTSLSPALEKGLLIIPNPSRGKYEILNYDDQNVMIYNLLGTVVYRGRVSSFDISNQPSGYYVVKIFDGSQNQTFRIMKY